MLSVTLSVAVSPILATLVGRFSSLTVVCWILLIMAAADLVLIAVDLKTQIVSFRLSRNSKIAISMVLAWSIVAIASMADLQIGEKLYLPAQSFDQCLRSALAASAQRTGVPPANPFFYPGHAVPMRYYYYWNVLCALPAKLFGLDARVTTLAGVIWSGFALASLIPLYLKYFCEETVELGRKAMIGIGLLTVTGLDLIPTVMIFLGERSILGDMEWWDEQQVTSWLDSLLWVPHHVAGMVACLMGLLVLWVLPRNATAGQRIKVAIVAALAFASAAGLSVYVTFTFALFLVIWTVVLLRSQYWAEVLTFVLAGIVTLILSLGYLHDLQQTGLSGSFAIFYVRSLESFQDWSDQHIPWDWLQSVFLALLLPVYYTVELGFLAIVGFVQAKRYWRRPAPLQKWEWASLCIAGTSLLVGSFLISTTGNNDLGYRSVLFAQFMLLLWAVPLIYRWRTHIANPPAKMRLLYIAFLAIGVLGTVYQFVELRLLTILADRKQYVDEIAWLPHGDNIAKDVYLARSGFSALTRTLPPDAIIQYSPTNPAYVPNLYYARFQSVDGQTACGTAFGGDPFYCMVLQNKIAPAFNGRIPFTLADANQLCNDLGIDVLIAERSDRMWSLKQSWIWTGTPVVANAYLRALACGTRRRKIEDLFATPRQR